MEILPGLSIPFYRGHCIDILGADWTWYVLRSYCIDNTTVMQTSPVCLFVLWGSSLPLILGGVATTSDAVSAALAFAGTSINDKRIICSLTLFLKNRDDIVRM